MTSLSLSLTHRPYLIGIAGGTASGKTTMTNTIVRTVGPRRVTVISYDSYYRDLSHLPLEDRLRTNLDHPHALDTGLLVQHLMQLRRGEPVEVPLYDFATCVRQPGSQPVAPTDVIIVDGILTLAEAHLRELFDLKIFVDLSADERILRRIERDIIERGRTVRSVVDQYRETVRPMHDQFVEPSKKYADFIVPGDAARSEALETVAAQVQARILIARLDTLEQLGGHLLSDALDHEVLLTLKERIVRAAAHTLNADDVTLHQYATQAGGFLPTTTHSATWPAGGPLGPPRADGVSAYVVQHGTVVVTNVDSDLSEDLRSTAYLQARGTRAFLGLRLQAGAEALGVLFVNYRTPRTFDPYERAVAQVFALYAAAALLTARHTHQPAAT